MAPKPELHDDAGVANISNYWFTGQMRHNPRSVGTRPDGTGGYPRLAAQFRSARSVTVRFDDSTQWEQLAPDVVEHIASILDPDSDDVGGDYETRITTQQAADILGVSRPFVVALLERGEIPFERLGASSHRRIKRGDVLAYQDSMRETRRDALAEMTREAAELGLYEPPSQHSEGE